METLGKPNQVHVSETCAQALRDGGKEHWLVAREDTVVAKGKGEMQTYWVQVPDTMTSSSAGNSIISEITPPLQEESPIIQQGCGNDPVVTSNQAPEPAEAPREEDFVQAYVEV